MTNVEEIVMKMVVGIKPAGMEIEDWRRWESVPAWLKRNRDRLLVLGGKDDRKEMLGGQQSSRADFRDPASRKTKYGRRQHCGVGGEEEKNRARLSDERSWAKGFISDTGVIDAFLASDRRKRGCP